MAYDTPTREQFVQDYAKALAIIDGLRTRHTDLARAALQYDEAIQEVARQRGIAGSGAWSVDGALGERLDALYFDLMEKARAALP